ncbi:hypothetical protein HPB51_002267 [Rhipicephalus microplus]|uniref:Transposable element n=1 Tax=Rhipicephalus microplus TaxID=6941 RepID=A0A9J6DZ33_RHIMP|nr:hypothetical protein HPB51_002267 [Rhipicephalus microplus]
MFGRVMTFAVHSRHVVPNSVYVKLLKRPRAHHERASPLGAASSSFLEPDVQSVKDGEIGVSVVMGDETALSGTGGREGIVTDNALSTNRYHRLAEATRGELRSGHHLPLHDGFQKMQKFGVFGSGQFAVKGGALRMETACALYISLLSASTALGKRRDCGWEVCPRRFQLFRLICRNLPAAYEYVRSKFNEALPSQRTLRGWYKSIQGAPGFTAEAFAFLEKFAEARDEPFYCALIVDDMAIRKHVELVGDKDFCENVLKLPQFRGASATSKFVRVFDHLFYLFNSRNPFARSYKAPLRKQNEACWKPFFAYTQAYIKGLRDPAGPPVLEDLKKTGFVGFLICMASTEKMFDELVGQGKLKYLLTHKLSQDHAENFFGSVRGRGGYNNNPTAAQFMAAYKRLLVQTEVTSSSSGNCTKDMVSILNATTVVAQVDSTSALTDMRRSSILEPHDDHDYTHPENLSAVVVAVVPYIAGFVVRQVCKTTTCEECIAALYSDELVPLVEQENRGGLVSPSKDVIGLCEAVEKGLRQLQIECGTLQAVNSQSKHLVLEVLRLSVEEKWFRKLEQHILDLDPLDNHIYSLCKKVAELYVKIRIHHKTKVSK